MRAFAILILAATSGRAQLTTPPAPAAGSGSTNPPRAVRPIETVREGPYEVKQYRLQPGEFIELERGGRLAITRIGGDKAGVLRGTVDGAWDHELAGDWPLDERIHAGNREYIELSAVDNDPEQIVVKLETKVDFTILDAFSF